MHRAAPAPRLSFLTPRALLTAGLVAALVAVITLLFGGILFSPGALNARAGPAVLGGVAAHAGLNDCAACHPAPWSGQSMSGLCLDCHTDLRDDPQNFHQVMVAQGQSSTCTACHTEHHGASASLTTMDLRDFPHTILRFSLQGHPKMADGSAFACGDCHVDGYERFDAVVCANCHTQLDAAFMPRHAAAFGADCLACHDGIDTYGPHFDHQLAAFPLAGKHAPLACEKCHSQARTIADLKTAPTPCAACHAKDDAHQGSMGQDCAQCHTPEGWEQASIDHSLTRFPLTGKHSAVSCAACHVNRVFKGTPMACSACHADPAYHKGLFGLNCATCHTPAAWIPAKFSQPHTFPIDHEGARGDCRRCHTATLAQYTCNTCHDQNEMVREHRGRGDITNCIACHPTGRKEEGGRD